MSPLQARISRIQKSKLHQHNWMKYWAKLKEWSQTEGSTMLFIVKIKTYLNAPIMTSFNNIKEEVVKFLVIHYHDSKIWLNKPIEITPKLINFIIGLPVKGYTIQARVKNMDLVEKFIGSSNKGKISKGLQINSIDMMMITWGALTVSICLTSLSIPSDVKLNMLESIDNIAYHSKFYNWVAHIVEILKTNYKRCQELDTSIHFPSLLIWIPMTRFTLMG